MKFLIIGANGMAGHMVFKYLEEKGHQVIPIARHRSNIYSNLIQGDLLDNKFLIEITEQNVDFIINCAGILNTSCDIHPANAIYVNSYLPHKLAEMVKDTDTRIIHLSTDCVFSGKKGSYIESSYKDGETYYDKTKALGELEDNKNLTFRMSIIGPDLRDNGIGLLNWFMHQRGRIYGYSKVFWSGVTTLTLAKAIEKAAQDRLTGVYHLVNNEKISKFELLNLFNKYLRKEKIEIIEEKNIVSDKSLVNTRQDFNFYIPSYEKMIIELGEWIKMHKEWYPENYFI